MKQATRIKILDRFAKDNPKPIIELHFCSPFELLISTLLSAQSTDIMVNKVTKKLYSKANDPISFLEIGLDNIKKYIQPIGLHNIKALNIIKICHILLKKYNSQIPNNRIELEKLPGIGPKTASIILNIIFDQPTIAVDTHVFRFCNRTGFALGKNVKQVENKLLQVVPDVFKKNCHLWIVLHGRHVCKYRKPKCTTCNINDLCDYYRITNI
ncbi:endonuclease III [Pantoea sp. SoEX]|uniref:endonuclease III n=1 Tax=Pantoea sp. SoEX TaxID=2576763 RepID=UPI00135B4A5A|nr:endonuclease III [Pantoea sp. SoEX]MXP50957.1 endonuclease III [Pantoea sp. SoEX]